MSRRLVVAALVGTAMFLAAGSASAFDGQRHGFMLGIGLGAGFSSFTQEIESPIGNGSGSDSKGGLATEFRIGGGIGNQFFLYYSNKVNWFSIENVNNDKVTIADGVGSVAGQYFFKPESPSGFVSGGLGIGGWSTPMESNSSSLSGFGMFAGGGYEFSHLWSVEGSLSYASPSTSELGVKFTTKSTGVRVMLHLTGY
jgi:hypothetical protein